MKNSFAFMVGAMLLFRAVLAAGDIVITNDRQGYDGKIISSDDKHVVLQPDGQPTTQPETFDRSTTSHVVYADEHGGAAVPPGAAPATQPVNFDIPPEPTAPPIVALGGNTYYVIPLHGPVGSTILASALEKSLADAEARKPTAVILDIDSPGGLVAEAIKIVQIIHHYNKKLRIVALTNQDLSAAAVFSLSVKTIYVKPTSTIGAATSYIPGQPNLSAKVEEKMQSAWRAVARNSAEEGGHDPLLANAMIDNNISLHLETVDGKPVIKEGDGDKMMCKKGEILTLTSHEAVDCGLAVDDAEDFAAVGSALGMANWTECKGLGMLYSDYLPKLDQTYQTKFKTMLGELVDDLETAGKDDPSQMITVMQDQNGMMRRVNPNAPAPVQPPQRPGMPMGMRGNQPGTVRQFEDRPHWKEKSLLCVIEIQKAEQDLRDMAAMCTAFGHGAEADAINDSLSNLSATRAKMYDDRNKWVSWEADRLAQRPGRAAQAGGQPNPTTQPAQAGDQAGQPAQPGPRANRTRPGNSLTDPSPEDAAAQLAKIDQGWQPSNDKPVEILPSMTSNGNDKADDGSILLGASHNVTSVDKYKAPTTVRIVLMNSGGDLRIGFPTRHFIFNWEMNADQLRVDGGPINGKHKDGAGRIPANEWVGIEIVTKLDEVVVYVDGQERYRQKGDFSAVNQTISVVGHGGLTKVKSVSVITDAN